MDKQEIEQKDNMNTQEKTILQEKTPTQDNIFTQDKIIKCGDFTINDFLKERILISDSDVKSLEKSKREIEYGDSILMDRLPANSRACSNINQTLINHYYPVLDVGFLTEGIENMIPDVPEIKLPRFSPYRYSNKKDFGLRICKHYKKDTLEIKFEDVNKILTNHLYRPIIPKQKILQVTTTFMDAEIQLIPEGKFWGNTFYKQVTSIRDKLKTELYTIIPSNTRKQVEHAKKYFNDYDIYIISDNKPNNWLKTQFAENVIIIGFNNEQAHLITYNNQPLTEDVKQILMK